MNIQELRVGVYVNLEDKGVYMIDSGQDIATIDNCWTGTDYCTGIPLTEEWLLKFGFKQQKQFFLFHKSKRQVDFNVFSWETPVGQSNGVPAPAFYIIINSVIVVLEYVHQLQNLYFALVGEELQEIKKAGDC